MRPTTRALALIVALLAALTSCGLTSGPTATALTVYTSRPKAISTSVLAAFEAARPEYKGRVRILSLGAGELAQRVRAEQHRPQADVWWGGTSQQFEQGAKAGLLEPTSRTVIDRIPAQYRGSGDTWLAEMRMAQVIVYNNEMITADRAPKDWSDLVKPEWRDKILIRDVAASGTMRSIWTAMIWQTFQHTGTPDQGYDYLRGLDRNTKDYTASPSDLYLRIQRREAPLTVWNLQDILGQKAKGVPFTAVMPMSGAPILLDGVGVVKDAPHRDVADQFLDFLLSSDMQQKLANKSFQLPTVAIPQEPSWLAEIGLRELPVNWPEANKHEKTWLDHWVQNIKNRG